MTAESIKQKPITKTTTKRPRTPKAELIIKTAQDHPDLTTREIGAIADCSHVNVITTLKRYGINHNNLQRYKTNRADILAGLQERLLSSITLEDIQKAPLGSRVLAACQIYDKERLELNKSTSNSAIIHDSVERINQLRDKINLFDEGESES